MLDFVLRGGLVADGTGAPARTSDLGVRNGRIVAVGSVSGPARQEISVEGLVVAPGFIDVHTHDDRLVLSSPDMAPKVSQGITTVIVGNCGISLAPRPRGPVPVPPLTLLSEQGSAFFADIAAYRAALLSAPAAVNVFALIGHTALRARVLDDLERPACEREIAEMQGLLRDALLAGASGLSTGLAYPPAQAAPSAEVEALLAVVAEAGGMQTAHVRDEGDGLMGALEEALVSARQTRTPLVISHLKCAGPKVWGRAAKVLARLDQAQREQSVSFDIYPYDASSTMLRGDRLKGARKVVVSWSQPHPERAGQDIADVARCWCCSPEEAADRLAPGGGIFYKMQERDVRRILAHPLGMIGSDGLPHDQHPHPRLWGTFPRVLGHYVRKLKLLTLEEAVRRMTSLPADVFGIANRGRLVEGAVADLAVFNPRSILDEASFDHPIRPARGVERVMVAGQTVWEAGQSTGLKPGRWLRRAGMAPLAGS